MILFVNVMFEFETFDDWSWLRTGGGGCGEPEITGSSRCLYYFSVFMCKTGLFQPKGKSREGLDIALLASFTPRIGISILWCEHHNHFDEHNDIIAGDIITIQKRTDKMSCYSKFDRIKMT